MIEQVARILAEIYSDRYGVAVDVLPDLSAQVR